VQYWIPQSVGHAGEQLPAVVRVVWSCGMMMSTAGLPADPASPDSWCWRLGSDAEIDQSAEAFS